MNKHKKILEKGETYEGDFKSLYFQNCACLFQNSDCSSVFYFHFKTVAYTKLILNNQYNNEYLEIGSFINFPTVLVQIQIVCNVLVLI